MAQIYRNVANSLAAILTILVIAIMALPVYGQNSDDLERLFAQLRDPDGDAWLQAELDILRIWTLSGSPAMDLLAERGEGALDLGDLPLAIGHLTALTDHAPDFAMGWQLRGVAYYLNGNYGLAGTDLAQALVLEPRNFLALTQLGVMLEDMGDPRRALAAYQLSLDIHPHQEDAIDAAERLENELAGTDI